MNTEHTKTITTRNSLALHKDFFPIRLNTNILRIVWPYNNHDKFTPVKLIEPYRYDTFR